MSHSKAENLHFYKYLCYKIGTEKVVRARRLNYTCKDFISSNKFFDEISSGSRGEGLDLEGSDFDIMSINYYFAVYESEKDALQDFGVAFVMDTEETMPESEKDALQDCGVVLVMDTEETQPCFTHLRVTNYNSLSSCIKQVMEQHRGHNLLSSELYKSQLCKQISLICPNLIKIHGPCLSDKGDYMDFASCLKCDKWVFQAQPWISRSRLTWPSPELISKITSCGVLFVPIGNKGSINENLQWRISFSIAEKILIYSFSHTQLLCYALLKILLKEIVEKEKVDGSEKDEDLKGLLCSYFLKTLLFWISEETETSVWRPDNIIHCFTACLKRLIYCIEYSTLLHYFIPDNNLFYLRFTNIKHKNILINILKKSCETGIQIFSLSKTLHRYKRFPNKQRRSESEVDQLIKEISGFNFHNNPSTIRVSHTLHTLLHHCKTGLSKGIFFLSLSLGYQRIARPHLDIANNKQLYKNYKHDLSHLLVGVHSDALSGWLKLASYFCLQKNHFASIEIINNCLSKCTDDKISVGTELLPIIKLNRKQKHELKLVAQEKLTLVLKTKILNPVIFAIKSSVIPTELKLEARVNFVPTIFDPIAYAHFLHFLCCYHQQDFISCGHCITQLLKTSMVSTTPIGPHDIVEVCKTSQILLGIAYQIQGKKSLAKKMFREVAQCDKNNTTSAALRLAQL
ncbi:Hypothetical predicted protein [Mytilus galloprovincialis]|uniref:Mab-21-like HhH/H2TH-like domain-containing protein n=1 Tax=Mytilus galloprovincialis TaxID=29158 RepID=A0A8B6CYT3_MYTGA|nr:Hypothetical predicted protein [Mytilus galloprovincialis]